MFLAKYTVAFTLPNDVSSRSRARAREYVFQYFLRTKNHRCASVRRGGTRASCEMKQVTRVRSINLVLRCTIYRSGFSVLQFMAGIYRGDSSCPENRRRFQGKVNTARRCKPLNFARKQSKTTDRHRYVELNHFPRPISDAIKPPGGGRVARRQRRDGRSGIVRLIFSRALDFYVALRAKLPTGKTKVPPVSERYLRY